MKLLSTEKLQQKEINLTGTLCKGNDETLAMAIKNLTSPIPVEEQNVDLFLKEDEFTNPKFKPNKKTAEKLLKLRYDDEEKQRRDTVTGAIE